MVNFLLDDVTVVLPYSLAQTCTFLQLAISDLDLELGNCHPGTWMFFSCCMPGL